MISEKARAGAFLLGGTLLFAGGLFLIGNREKVFNRSFDVYTDFSSVAGLVTGSNVRVSGLQAGELLEIQAPSQPSGQYRLKVRLEDKIHNLIRQDSMASIASDGLVGDKFLEIDKGSDDSPVCPAGCTIPSTEPFDLSDLIQNSRQLLDTTNSTVESAGEVADNLNRVLDSFLTKGPTGQNGATDLKETVVNAQRATSNLADDTEALKHNFLLRGFFHSRGFYDLKELTPAQYRTSKFAKSHDAKRVWLNSSDLFSKPAKGPEQLTPGGKRDLDNAMDAFVGYLPNRPLIIEGYSSQGAPDEQYRTSQERADVVERYLQQRFSLDPNLVGEIPLESTPPPASGRNVWDGVSLVLLP